MQKNKMKENSETDYFLKSRKHEKTCTLIQVPIAARCYTLIHEKLYTNQAQIRKCMYKNSNKLLNKMFCCQEGDRRSYHSEDGDWKRGGGLPTSEGQASITAISTPKSLVNQQITDNKSRIIKAIARSSHNKPHRSRIGINTEFGSYCKLVFLVSSVLFDLIWGLGVRGLGDGTCSPDIFDLRIQF